jgi:hypothetical protein
VDVNGIQYKAIELKSCKSLKLFIVMDRCVSPRIIIKRMSGAPLATQVCHDGLDAELSLVGVGGIIGRTCLARSALICVWCRLDPE